MKAQTRKQKLTFWYVVGRQHICVVNRSTMIARDRFFVFPSKVKNLTSVWI